MKRPRCQAQNREGMRFCQDRGVRLGLICAVCGAEASPTQLWKNHLA